MFCTSSLPESSGEKGASDPEAAAEPGKKWSSLWRIEVVHYAEIITAKEFDQEVIATEVDENLKEELDAEFEEAFN